MQRAKERAAGEERDFTPKEIWGPLSVPRVSDEEFLLRYIMKGEQETEAMRAAGSPKQYFSTAMRLVTLVEELGKHKQVRYVQVQRGGDSLVVQNQASG